MNKTFWDIVGVLLSSDEVQNRIAAPTAKYISEVLTDTQDTVVASFLEKVAAELRKHPA